MSQNRPLMKESADSLEILIQRYHDDPVRLRAIADELGLRSTSKAHALLAQVAEALAANSGGSVAPALDQKEETESPAQGQKTTHDPKLVKLVDYLQNLARITTPTVLDLSNYQNVIWLDKIPRDKSNCFSRHWGADEEAPDDVWVDITKVPEPPLPAGLKTIEAWIETNSLYDINGAPKIKSVISVTTSKAEPETGEKVEIVQTLELVNHPEVRTTFDTWVEQKWRPWTVAQRRYLEVQKVYGELFTIFQEQQRLGEQYELVMSLGLLVWKPSQNLPVVRRHLITGKASLEYDASNGHFTVRVSPDGDQTELEFDMIDSSVYPANAASLVDSSHSLRDNFWDRTQVNSVLASVANSLEGKGRGIYDSEALLPSGQAADSVPRVEFAPALILRKRSTKGLIAILNSMRRHIMAGAEVPQQFLELCEVVDHDDNAVELVDAASDGGDFGEPGPDGRPPERIYFPLPSNPQQRAIIRKHTAKRGVLVQGPPGTGKSTTIANLICHLLATGQRILVTAKTHRALEVLHEKIPVDVAPLCISMLGASGTDERLSLSRSVDGILTRANSRDDARDQRRVIQLDAELAANLEKRAALKTQIIGLRERESYEHRIVDNLYVGTAAAIATRVRDESERFSWFIDALAETDGCPLSRGELARLQQLVSDVSIDAEVELSQYFPAVGKDVPSPGTLRDDWSLDVELRALVASGQRLLTSVDGMALSSTTLESVANVLSELDKLSAAIGSVLNRPMPWLATCVREVLNDVDRPWKELGRLTTDRMRLLKAQAEKVKGYTVEVPKGVNRRRLAADARTLRDHYASGKGLKRWMGLSDDPIVKKHCDTLSQCSVDGKSCLETDSLSMLIDYLGAEQAIFEVWGYWQGKTTHKQSHHFIVEIALIEEHLESLEHALELYDVREHAIKAIAAVAGLARPHWGELAAVNELAQTCRIVQAKAKLDVVRGRLHAAEGQVAAAAAKVNAHPLCAELLAAFRAVDSDAYFRIADQIHNLGQRFENVVDKRALLCRLAIKAPLFTSVLTSTRDVKVTLDRLGQLEPAWSWRRALSWLDAYETADDATLERAYRRLEDAYLKALAELASLKAWTLCLGRMKTDHQAHLQAWQLAMKRVGKGTGKHAHKHRADAQRHLNTCKIAVPAWIMPLHRVYETVEASPGAFDVIIVDEASQAGYESLPLLFLGKKLIVVGDEMQISPETPGVDGNVVTRLIETHLNQFNLRDSFNMESSLFAHGLIRFGNRIVLQEHFRCAPEIIRFSDRLCYQSNPLIPLKQCPPNRLEPLRAIHVPGGHREGQGDSVVNHPEALVLAEKIKECVEDPRYAGMTMGVISLQGGSQAKIIENLLLKSIGIEEMQERRLLCGSPYSFQGDERDIIFLSMVAALGETRVTAVTKENDMRRYNVAASRAKEQLWLFHSVTLNDLSSSCYRYKLLSHFLNDTNPDITGFDFDELRRSAYRANRSVEDPPEPFDSWFEIDVALTIAAHGYTVVPQFAFAGYRIDLVIQGGSSMLAVECDGARWHGPDALDGDFRRQRTLQRCGWVFFRVSDSAFRFNPEKALAGLWPLLEERGIYPANGHTRQKFAVSDAEASVANQASVETVDVEDELDHILEEEHEGHEEKDEEGLFDTCVIEGCPKSVNEMLALKPIELRRLIHNVISAKSGRTCVREHVGALVLKACKVRTSGQPRLLFMRKVEGQVAAMCRNGELLPYKSKNNRLKLGWKASD